MKIKVSDINGYSNFDGSAEYRLIDILRIMETKTFGKVESASIVGGRGRLVRLMDEGKVRVEKPTNKQNGKWFCNAADVLRYAVVRNKKNRKSVKLKRYEKNNDKRATA